MLKMIFRVLGIVALLLAIFIATTSFPYLRPLVFAIMVAALVGTLVFLAWTYRSRIGSKLINAWPKMKKAWPNFSGLWSTIKWPFTKLWNTAKWVWSKIKHGRPNVKMPRVLKSGKWMTLFILALVVVTIPAIVTYSVIAPLLQPSDSAAISPQATQNQGEEVPGQPAAVLFIAFPTLFVILVAVIIWAVADAKRPHKGKTGEEAKTPITEVLQQPVIAALGGVIILNILASLFAYPAWKWYFDRPVLFFGINMGVPIFVHFIMKKDNAVCKWIAWGMLGSMIAGFFFSSWESPDGGENQKEASNSAVVTSQITRSSYINVPASIAVPIFCDAESGKDGIPGSAHQFETDEDGNQVVVRNPPDGEPGTGAVGACQINLNDSAVVAFLQEHGFTKEDMEENEADNREVARLLYQDFINRGGRGTHPFEESRVRWEHQLRAYTWGGEAVSLIVMAPVGTNNWSGELSIPPGKSVEYDSGGQTFIARKLTDRRILEEEMPRNGRPSPLQEGEYVRKFWLRSPGLYDVPVTIKFF